MKSLSYLFLTFFLLQTALGQEAQSSKNDASSSSYRTGKIAAGTAWETDFHVIDSGRNGPTVLVVGGMHGNEPAGSRAAEQIRHWPIVSGKLVVIPKANVLALKAKTRLTPGQPEEAGNLNRNFPEIELEEKNRVKPRGELASALWRFAIKMKPDWVLDLHEGYEFNRTHKPEEGEKKSVGSSVIYLGGEKMDPLAKKIVEAADATVTAPERHFSLLRRGPVPNGLARSCITVMGAEALILETTFKKQPMSLRTRQHRAMTNVILNHIGLISSDCTNCLASPENDSDTLRVALFDDKGTGPSSFKLMEVIDDAPDLTLHHIGPAEVTGEVLKQFDVVVFPGGNGSKQGSALSDSGRTAVREFISSGGGVVGVCAGAYLCSSNFLWSLDVIDSQTKGGSVQVPGKGKKSMWYRGPETGIDIELTKRGEALFGSEGIPKTFEVIYGNGPIITPHPDDNLEEYEVLASFRTENGLWEAQKGNMINTPAIVSGHFGKGRVMSVSPHPELTPSLHPIITQAVRWTSGKLK